MRVGNRNSRSENGSRTDGDGLMMLETEFAFVASQEVKEMREGGHEMDEESLPEQGNLTTRNEVIRFGYVATDRAAGCQG